MSFDFDLVRRKNDLGKRRVSRVSSTIKKIVSEIIHLEFSSDYQQFSVIDVSMSVDLRYADIFIRFYDLAENDQLNVLSELNSDNKTGSCLNKKIPIKYYLASKISKKILLKYTPEIRFKIMSDNVYNGMA